MYVEKEKKSLHFARLSDHGLYADDLYPRLS